MFRKIGDWFRNFMLGRYGSDKLNGTLLLTGVVLLVLGSVFRKLAFLNLLAYVPLFWCIFRMYSRNLEARRRENTAFLNFFNHLKDREHRYYACPKCKQQVRVPKGKGKIAIICPKCREKFIKKT